eukprot:tig00020554_g10807.t1
MHTSASAVHSTGAAEPVAAARSFRASPTHSYFAFEIDFARVPDHMDAITCKNILSNAFRASYGIAGSSSGCDLLRFDAGTRRGIVRVARSDGSRLWASLTLAGQTDGNAFAIRVLGASSHLQCLATFF